MNEDFIEPKRRWWHKKRWLAAGLLWLAFGYMLSEGPTTYAVSRGWISLAAVRPLYGPLDLIRDHVPSLATSIQAHRRWWSNLGSKHRPRFVGMSGEGWEITVSTDIDLQSHTHTTRDEGDSYTVRAIGHEIIVENGHRSPEGVLGWDGPVTLDGEPIANLPKGTRRLSIEYFDGEVTVEADGVAAETVK